MAMTSLLIGLKTIIMDSKVDLFSFDSSLRIKSKGPNEHGSFSKNKNKKAKDPINQ